jgi:hypothetical protein
MVPTETFLSNEIFFFKCGCKRFSFAVASEVANEIFFLFAIIATTSLFQLQIWLQLSFVQLQVWLQPRSFFVAWLQLRIYPVASVVVTENFPIATVVGTEIFSSCKYSFNCQFSSCKRVATEIVFSNYENVTDFFVA